MAHEFPAHSLSQQLGCQPRAHCHPVPDVVCSAIVRHVRIRLRGTSSLSRTHNHQLLDVYLLDHFFRKALQRSLFTFGLHSDDGFLQRLAHLDACLGSRRPAQAGYLHCQHNVIVQPVIYLSLIGCRKISQMNALASRRIDRAGQVLVQLFSHERHKGS